MIDWSKPDDKVSKYFTVEEALLLLTWRRMADESDGLTDDIKSDIIKAALIFDKVREFLGEPMHVHSFYRPAAYSARVGGSATDVHVHGIAMDFHVSSKSCDEVKAILMPKLKELGIRMEDNGKGAGWVHIDIREPGPSGRFFKP